MVLGERGNSRPFFLNYSAMIGVIQKLLSLVRLAGVPLWLSQNEICDMMVIVHRFGDKGRRCLSWPVAIHGLL